MSSPFPSVDAFSPFGKQIGEESTKELVPFQVGQDEKRPSSPISSVAVQGEVEEPIQSKEEVIEPVQNREEVIEPAQSREEVIEPAQSREEVVEPAQSKDEVIEPAQSKEEVVEPIQSKEEVVEPAQSKEEVVEPVQSKEEVIEPAQSKEEVVEPAQSKEEVVEPAQSKEEVIEPAQSKEEVESSQSRQVITLSNFSSSSSPPQDLATDKKEVPSDEVNELSDFPVSEEEEESSSFKNPIEVNSLPPNVEVPRWMEKGLRHFQLPSLSKDLITEQQRRFDAFLQSMHANQSNTKGGRGVVVYQIHRESGLGNMIRGYITSFLTAILTGRNFQSLLRLSV